MKRRLLLLLAVAVLVRSLGIAHPWTFGNHDGWGGAFYSNIARNYNRIGFLETRGAPVTNTGETLPQKREYYLTHPPLIGIAVALSFRIFGEHEWSARLVPLLFGLANLLLVFRLASGLWSKETSLLASAIVAFAPEEILYGTHVDPQGPPVTFFALLLLLAYREGRARLALGALLLGAAFDWPIHYMVGLIALDALLFVPARRRLALPLVAVSALLVVAFFAYARAIAPTPEQRYQHTNAIESLLYWSGVRVSPERIPGRRMEVPRLTDWVARAAAHVHRLFTIPMLLLAAAGVYATRTRARARVLVLLLAWGGLHVLIFPFGAFEHEYWWSYLLPGFAIAAAAGLMWVADRLRVATLSQRHLTRVQSALGIALCLFLLREGLHSNEELPRESAELGRFLRDITLESEGVLWFYPVDVRDAYYADRRIVDRVNNFSRLEKVMADGTRYHYFVVPQFAIARRPEKPLFRRLVACCRRLRVGDAYLFDLTSRYGLTSADAGS